MAHALPSITANPYQPPALPSRLLQLARKLGKRGEPRYLTSIMPATTLSAVLTTIYELERISPAPFSKAIAHLAKGL